MNIAEIARRSGVARSTVSYVLTGRRPVSEETRRRIQEVIDELDYRPNATARALKEGRTRTLGLVIPPAGTRLTAMQLGFVAAVVEAAARADLDVLLSPSGGDHDRSFDRLVSGQRVDGVILMEIRLEDPRAARLARTGIPFVTIGRVAEPDGTWWVDMDYAELVGQCVDHLADLGHREIALVNRPARLVDAGYGPGWRARAGFAEAVGRHGISGSEYCCEDDLAAGEKCVAEILGARPATTAIVTVNEAALPGVQRGLERAGHEVPRTFSVTGVVADQWAEEFHPPLTAADVPSMEMGAFAVELLAERIAGPSAVARHRLITSALALRDSTGPAPRPSARPAFFGPTTPPARLRGADGG